MISIVFRDKRTVLQKSINSTLFLLCRAHKHYTFNTMALYAHKANT